MNFFKNSLIASAIVLTAVPATSLTVICFDECEVEPGEGGGGGGGGYGGGGDNGGGDGGGYRRATLHFDEGLQTYISDRDMGPVWIPCNNGSCVSETVVITGRRDLFVQITDLADTNRTFEWLSSGYGVTVGDPVASSPPYNDKKERCVSSCNSAQSLQNNVCDWTGAQLNLGAGLAAVGSGLGVAVGTRSVQVGTVATGAVYGVGIALASQYTGMCKGLAASRNVTCVTQTCGK